MEIVGGTERARLTKEASDLRFELQAAIAAREEAMGRLAVSEERSKTYVATC